MVKGADGVRFPSFTFISFTVYFAPLHSVKNFSVKNFTPNTNPINTLTDDYIINKIKYNEAIDKKKLLEFARFSKLTTENENNLPIILQNLYNSILSVHESTKNIFL